MNFGTWIGIVVFFIGLYILWQIKQLLLLLFTAVVVATSLNLLVKSFCQKGIKRSYGVLFSIVLLFGLLFAFFSVIVPAFISQFEELGRLIPEAIERIDFWIDIAIDNLEPELISYLPDTEELSRQIQPLVNQFLGSGLTFFRGSLGVLLSLLLLLVITLMMLANPIAYRQGFIRLFPSFYRERIAEILDLCESALQGWLLGVLFNVLIISVLSFICLSILRIDLALAQAILAGLLSFIPNVGPVISVLSPMAIAILDAPWKALAVLILYTLIQQIESNFLTPYVMARQVSLLPAITLLSQVFFASFFGFLGLLLALPLTVVGQVWIKEVLVRDILDKWENPEMDKINFE